MRCLSYKSFLATGAIIVTCVWLFVSTNSEPMDQGVMLRYTVIVSAVLWLFVSAIMLTIDLVRMRKYRG